MTKKSHLGRRPTPKLGARFPPLDRRLLLY